MSKSFKRISVFAAALAAALTALPLTAPVAAADPPRWAPAHGYRDGHAHGHGYGHRHGHHKFKHKYRTQHFYWRGHEVRRPYRSGRHHHHYNAPRRYRGADLSISPSLGGAIIGGLIGGLGGSQIGSGSGRTAAIIGGIAAGAVIGGSVGRSMEDADRAQVQNTLETARTGQTIIWNNPRTGNRYEVTPTRTYRAGGQRYCREYTTWVFLGGYEQQVHGTACRMPDGSWQRQAG